MIIAVVISAIMSLIVNIRIFMYGHSSSRRVQVQSLNNHIESISNVVSNRTNTNRRPRISRRDIRLLKHMIYMFLMFIVGWGPFYTLMISGQNIDISTFVYGFFCIWGQISLVFLISSMFIYNIALRKYLVTKMFPGF